jgi:hypothetical protein
MVPGLSEADCMAAGFRHQQMRAEAQRQRAAGTASRTGDGADQVPAALRRLPGALLARVGWGLKSGQRPAPTYDAAGTVRLAR